MTRLIDADALAEKIEKTIKNHNYDDLTCSVGEVLRQVIYDLRGEGIQGFDYAPTIAAAVEWIEMKTRPATSEEKEHYSYYFGDEIDTMFDCPLPDDGEECLISTTCGGVYIDQFDADYNSFCDHDDPDEVVAWAKLPEPYKKT